MGAATTVSIPLAANARRWSPISGSSQGWPGGPLRLWYTSCHGGGRSGLGPLGDQLSRVDQLGDVVARRGHGDRDAVGGEGDLGRPADPSQRVPEVGGVGLDEPRWLWKTRSLSMSGASGPTWARARAMSSRY